LVAREIAIDGCHTSQLLDAILHIQFFEYGDCFLLRTDSMLVPILCTMSV
jgi:hypothetical protein